MTSTGSNTRLLLDAFRTGMRVLVATKGRLTLDNCEEVRKKLHELIDPKVDIFYIYMGELDYVDSAGWGALVNLKMVANRNRTRLCFLSPNERIMEIFRISKLDSIFEIKEGTEAELLRAELDKTENLLWRDWPTGSVPGEAKTEPKRGSVPVVSERVEAEEEPDSNEHREKIQQLSRDAIEHLKNGDYQKAVNTYLKILQLDPQDLSTLNNLGVVYEKRPEWYDKAVETWKRVLEASEASSDAKHAGRARKHLESLKGFSGD